MSIYSIAGVVDDHDWLLAPGEVGELVFRPRLTDAMARGYYKAPEATLAAFRNFMFHTGDLASIATMGDSCSWGASETGSGGAGRTRHRARGDRVGHDAVIEAAAYAVPGEFGEDEVKLDVVAAGDLTMPALHAWLVERLPRYMVPRYLERCSEFPKTPSERIEKHKLATRGRGTPRGTRVRAVPGAVVAAAGHRQALAVIPRGASGSVDGRCTTARRA